MLRCFQRTKVHVQGTTNKVNSATKFWIEQIKLFSLNEYFQSDMRECILDTTNTTHEPIYVLTFNCHLVSLCRFTEYIHTSDACVCAIRLRWWPLSCVLIHRLTVGNYVCYCYTNTMANNHYIATTNTKTYPNAMCVCVCLSVWSTYSYTRACVCVCSSLIVLATSSFSDVK